MRVEVSTGEAADSDAGLVCVGLFEGERLPAPFDSAPGAADARAGYRKLGLLRPERPERVLVVGLGKREEFDAERARVAAALAVREAGRFDATSLAWVIPGGEERIAVALVEGSVLGSYRFERYRKPENGAPEIERLELLGAPAANGLRDELRVARIASEAANRARELQNLPSNVVTPTYLAGRAEEIAGAYEPCSLEVLDREEMEQRGMGGLLAVSKGSAEPPRLIVLRYGGRPESGALALVGKAVTFDSGGISIKPSSRMHEMKMDMSGGAAVLEAVAAIAELGLELELLALVPATENLPSGTAVKPGDIIRQHNGKTVEVTNTDAEGRLILADALSYGVELGAARIVDLATLTGGVLTALGSTYAGLITNDDELAGRVLAAAEETGELAWRLPLHPEFKDLTKGTVTDLVNSSEKRKASTIYAGSFLEEFVDGRPWAHLDIAGTAWDVGREYVGKGPTGYGVRLLVALARELSG
jgi:leucyl aminopeptidase